MIVQMIYWLWAWVDSVPSIPNISHLGSTMANLMLVLFVKKTQQYWFSFMDYMDWYSHFRFIILVNIYIILNLFHYADSRKNASIICQGLARIH